MQLTAKQAHDVVAGTTNADYVINVNLPPWGSSSNTATPVKKTLTDQQKNLLTMGVILFALVVAIVFVSRRKTRQS